MTAAATTSVVMLAGRVRNGKRAGSSSPSGRRDIRIARDAHRRAEVHQRLIEVEDVTLRHQRLGQRPTDAASSRGFRIARCR